jgi:hypothetical protein
MSGEFTRERFACQSCPAFYKCERSDIVATAGGYEDKIIDGKKVICCRPGQRWGKGKPMKQYGYYCLATSRGKLIACVHDYTGKVPLWCPRLEAQKDD